MKVALVLHGSLRTFLMPLRENKNIRVCDIFYQNFIEANHPDIFISTDTNDFYYNGCQYFKTNNIDIMNRDAFRLYHKVSIMSYEEGKYKIETELRKLFGHHLKQMIIKDREDDVSEDEKFKILRDSHRSGSNPTMIVRQYKDLLSCAEMMIQYEKSNNVNYDIVIKCRFDCMYDMGKKLILSNYNFNKIDVFTPHTRIPLIYDFFAFGNRKGMEPYLKLYENLGMTLSNPTYIMECRNDGTITNFGAEPHSNPCPVCHKIDGLCKSDITIASEHHIYSLFQKLGIKYSDAKYHSYIYRYRDTSCSTPIDQIIKNELKLNDVVLRNHAVGTADVGEQKF